MKYIKAVTADIDIIYNLVQKTIRTIYPKYYPSEVVEFFGNLHCKENIGKDIKAGNVGILIDDDNIVGTGSYMENHITRVYVKPEHQGQGYGSYIIQHLEDEIAKNYNKAYLDASLPACSIYEHRGYETVRHDKWKCKNGAILVYEIMEKRLKHISTRINYDGKRFIPKLNTENGEVDNQTLFTYHQDVNTLWAEYSGGEVVKGYLIGEVSDNGELDFHYQHINVKRQVRIGQCHSIPVILDNGKIELHEEWKWLNGDMSTGKSVIREV